MNRFFLIALGGGLGSVARFIIGRWFQPFPVWPPLSILLINVVGSFVIAVVHFLSDDHAPRRRVRLGQKARLFLMTGVCGGFTTFSSFAYALYAAAAHSRWEELALNIFFSHAACLLAAWAGLRFCRSFQAQGGRRAFADGRAAGEQVLSEEESA